MSKIDAAAAQAELDKIEKAKRDAEQASAAATTESAPAAAAATEAAPAVAAAPEFVTRAELTAVVAAAVVEALKQNSAQAAPVAAAAAPAEAAAAPVQAAPAAAATITRDDIAAAVAEALKPMGERLERIEGTTVVRSAEKDVKQEQGEKGGVQNVFRGALGSFGSKE